MVVLNFKPLSAVDALVVELVAQESALVSWRLQRRMDLVEIKQPVAGLDVKLQAGSLAGDWLSQGYHALILPVRHQFDIIAAKKIRVRKQIENNAHSSDGPGNNITSAVFIKISPHHAIFHVFHLLSASQAASITLISQPFVPMYPKGVPGAKPKSF